MQHGKPDDNIHDICYNGHQSFKLCLLVRFSMTTINYAHYANKEKSSLSIFVASDAPHPGGLIELC